MNVNTIMNHNHKLDKILKDSLINVYLNSLSLVNDSLKNGYAASL